MLEDHLQISPPMKNPYDVNGGIGDSIEHDIGRDQDRPDARDQIVARPAGIGQPDEPTTAPSNRAELTIGHDQ